MRKNEGLAAARGRKSFGRRLIYQVPLGLEIGGSIGSLIKTFISHDLLWLLLAAVAGVCALAIWWMENFLFFPRSG